MASFTKHLPKIFLLLFLLVLLFAPEASLRGAKSGLLLWFHQVLPSLLPFFIVSGLIVATGVSQFLSHVFAPFLRPLFHCSQIGCYPILIGFLSGLPVGAKTIADFVKTGSITRTEGQYLLPLCNNSGPLFILNYIALSELGISQKKYWLLFFIYGSSILTALLSYWIFYSKQMSTSPTIPRKEFSKFSYSVLDTCIMNSFEILTKMGGYIILFSILAELLQLLPISNLCLCIGSGFLEITTGIHQIATLPLFFHKKIALIAAITSFGGLSGLAQTKSAISDSGLSLIPYVLVKILSACFAFCFTFLFYIV